LEPVSEFAGPPVLRGSLSRLMLIGRCAVFSNTGSLRGCCLRAVFALYELRQIAQVKKDLDSGLAPEAALQKLADSDKTGIVSKVIDAHKSQITRLNGLGDLQSAAESAAQGDPDAARRLSAAVAAMSGAGAPRRSGGAGPSPGRCRRFKRSLGAARAEYDYGVGCRGNSGERAGSGGARGSEDGRAHCA